MCRKARSALTRATISRSGELRRRACRFLRRRRRPRSSTTSPSRAIRRSRCSPRSAATARCRSMPHQHLYAQSRRLGRRQRPAGGATRRRQRRDGARRQSRRHVSRAPTGTGFTITGNNLPSPLAPGAELSGPVCLGEDERHRLERHVHDVRPDRRQRQRLLGGADPHHARHRRLGDGGGDADRSTRRRRSFSRMCMSARTDSQHVSVTNSAAAGAANLDVTLTASGDATASGAIIAIGAGRDRRN